MAAGPHEQRLRTYLAPARGWQVFIAKEQWKKGADSLKTVADAVQQVGPLARANLGSHTADAADQAFMAMHAEVLAREQQMREATVALQAALDAIGRAEAVRNGFDAQGPLSEPSPPDWDEDEVRQIQQMRSHRARMSAYTSQVAAREEAALAATQDLDSTNTSSAETMRKIQGERPEVPSSGGGGGGDGGLPPTGGRTAVPGPRDGPRPSPATSPPTEEPGNSEPQLPGETGTPLAPSAATTPVGMLGTLASPAPVAAVDVGTIGGLAGAVGGGLAGGARGPGGVNRGGSPEVGVGGTSGTTRVIGCSAPAGSAGALGRSSAAGSAAEPGTAARGAGGRGLDPGAAGAAGGRGGRKNEDDDGVQVEAVIDDQDWVDAEDAAPAVIG